MPRQILSILRLIRQWPLSYGWLAALLLPAALYGQKLDAVGKEKPLTISGGAAINQVLYGVSGIESRRSPYTYVATGNLNLTLYGWSIPLSFSLSNQNISYQQPFNQFTLHPTYKSVTAHIGYIGLSWSPYTVNGHTFLGGGAEAGQGKWKFSGLFGRFLKPVDYDTAQHNTPAYRRMGYGAKVNYSNEGTLIDFIIFHAGDQLNSIGPLPDSLNITPMENLVVSMGAGQKIAQRFFLKGEIASSAISHDIRSEQTGQSHPLAKTGVLFKPRLSSSYYNAFKSSFDWQQDAYTLGLAYERIAPQYRTLGAYYFNNDLESITINATTSILKGKVTVAMSVGTQRDNLDNSKISTLRRQVGSLTVNYTASQRLNFAASYSSFQTYTNIRSKFAAINQLTPYDNLDTLNFTQITRNATWRGAYALSADKKRRQNISLNLSYQGAADKQGTVQQNAGLKFYNANAAYDISLTQPNITLSLSFNAALSEGAADSKTLGPVLSLSKPFLEKKLKTQFSTTYNTTYNNGAAINRIINARLGAAYSVKKKHNLNAGITVVNRKSRGEGHAKAFTEFTGTIGYSYSFSTK